MVVVTSSTRKGFNVLAECADDHAPADDERGEADADERREVRGAQGQGAHSATVTACVHPLRDSEAPLEWSRLTPSLPQSRRAPRAQLWTFMHEEIYPNEEIFARQCHEIGQRSNEWTSPPIMVELKRKAKALGLWNLFLPVDSAALAGVKGGGLTNRQYAE
eukprot:1846778-Prymnesium_polylepis.1